MSDLPHAHAQQALVHALNEPALAHQGVLRLLLDVAASTKSIHCFTHANGSTDTHREKARLHLESKTVPSSSVPLKWYRTKSVRITERLQSWGVLTVVVTTRSALFHKSTRWMSKTSVASGGTTSPERKDGLEEAILEIPKNSFKRHLNICSILTFTTIFSHHILL